MTEVVEIYTDGACRGNPGPGGWAAILRYKDAEKELCGREDHTTNNRMELMAAIIALETLTRPCCVRLVTDSQYVKKGVTEWLASWKARNWRTASKSPVKNADLWKRLESAAARHEIEWHWVRGHSGHDGNERVDSLARQAIDSANCQGN